MSNQATDRIIMTGKWVFKEVYGFDTPVTKSDLIFDYMIALLEVAGADGILSDKEREWVVGLSYALGTSQDKLDELQAYQPKGLDKVLKTFHVDSGHVLSSFALMCLIYDGFRAAGADGELHEKEVAAIYTLAKDLGAKEEQVKQLWDLYVEEEKLRSKRLSAMFPAGPNNSKVELEKAY